MKQVVINIPDSCDLCGFREYIDGCCPNSYHDNLTFYRCALCNRSIAIWVNVEMRPEHFDTITYVFYPAYYKCHFITDDKKIWDWKTPPDWCPGKELNLSNGIDLDKHMMSED